MKHTKGPWNIGKYPEDSNEYIVIKNQTICTLDQGYYDNAIDNKTCKANAHLISLAPEMLEALEGCWARILAGKKIEPNSMFVKSVFEIIAKAKGE